MAHFEYLLDKIAAADFSREPFRHIRIADFFTAQDFESICASPDIKIRNSASNKDLFAALFDAGYKIIEFPGCVTDQAEYLAWHADRESAGQSSGHHSACEGFGMTLRLMKPASDLIAELQAFLASDRFNRALANKFDVKLDACSVDGGIQKYLDGYEISPHPDIRRKALTFMVNINPHSGAEQLDHHTHYMKLRPERSYVGAFWENNRDIDRCWVPWDWCETAQQQADNNSIVIFAPSDDTLHAVRARYDHLNGQRTQLYGNLWYRDNTSLARIEWEQLDLRAAATAQVPTGGLAKLSNLVPKGVKARASAVKSKLKRAPDSIARRNI